MNIQDMTVKELRQVARDNSLKIKGTKAELIERVGSFLETQVEEKITEVETTEDTVEVEAKATVNLPVELSTKAKMVLSAIANGHVGFFDAGVSEDSDAWSKILAEEVGVHGRVINSMVKKGIFIQVSAYEEGNGYGIALTKFGVEAVKAFEGVEVDPDEEEAKSDRPYTIHDLGHIYTSHHNRETKTLIETTHLGRAKWEVICRDHNTHYEVKSQDEADYLAPRPASYGWCKACSDQNPEKAAQGI